MKKIRRLLPALTMALALITACTCMVSAVVLPETDPGWSVSFTSGSELQSNFTTGNLDETISGMQPGDEAHFSISVANDNSEATDWYMDNAIAYSMEDRSANSGTKGGAYTYKLSYVSSSGEETVFFDSEAAGGDEVNAAGEGLHKATNGQEGWFYLGELASGASGKVNLIVALDGETQGNNYQDTLADLEMKFAVQLAERPEKTIRYEKTTGKKTGDTTNLEVYSIICGIAGILLLITAGYSLALRRREEGRDE